MLFYNGVILGAVTVDYIRAGETKFLLGWLMPHGVIEIPAILIAGQAGLLLAFALIGRGRRAAVPDAAAGNFRRCGHADFRHRPDAGLGGVHRGISFAISRASDSLRAPKSHSAALNWFCCVLFLWRNRDGKKHQKSRRMKTSTLNIRTPEGIVFSQSLAGPVTRFLAWFIDQLCIQRGADVLGLVISLLDLVSSNFAMAFYVIGYFVVSIGYGIFFEWTWRGQTIGKRLFRLRVMDVEGMRLQFNQIVVRNLLRFVDSLPAFYFVGGVTCWLNSKCQRLGDIAANTVVIRQPRLAEPDLDQAARRQSSIRSGSTRIWPPACAKISPAEADIALQALLRREEFDPVARVELVRRTRRTFSRQGGISRRSNRRRRRRAIPAQRRGRDLPDNSSPK